MASQGPIAKALTDSLRAAQIQARDKGGVALARRLAYLLDEARDDDSEPKVFTDLAPKYLATLTALGLTPAGRGVKGGGQDGGTGGGKLDELRRRREQRQG